MGSLSAPTTSRAFVLGVLDPPTARCRAIAALLCRFLMRRARIPHRSFASGGNRCAPHLQEAHMLDFAFVALGIGGLALTGLYAAALRRI